MVSVSIGASSKLDKGGGTLTGPLILARDPQLDLEAATRQFVLAHAGSGGGVQIAADLGGTLSAPLVIGTHLAAPLPLAQGGTGQVTAQSALTALAGTQAAGRYLRSDGTSTALAAIAAADVPALNQSTTGTASNITGVAAIANGGTGQSTRQAAVNALTGAQSAGAYLRSDGTNAALGSIQAGDVPTLNQNTTGSAGNITGIAAIANGGTGQSTQQAAINALTGTQSAATYLRSDGTNASLGAIQAADIPVLNQSTTGTAAGLSATLAITSGGTGATTAAGAVAGLGAVASDWCDMLGLGLLTAPPSSSAVTYAQSAGDLVLCLCTPSKTRSISTLGVWVTAAGVTGSGVNALMLFTEAGVLIDQTGDMTAAFSSAGMAEGGMGGSHTVTAGTNYFLAFLTHFSCTAPHFAATGTTQTANFPVINGHYTAIFKSAQATVPASFTPSSYTPNSGYFIMYGR